MSGKILMNKNTLAALKRELKEYKEALPIFEMKEQQLAGVVKALEEEITRLDILIRETQERARKWVAVLSEQGIDITHYISIQKIETERREIVGVTIETYSKTIFNEKEPDYKNSPLWVDAAIELIKELTENRVIIEIKKKELSVLEEELFEARRMKNALKEVFIPETKDNIRKIEIYLGDVERLSIGCAKLVKKKKTVSIKEVEV
ncbi:MAG: V-type ATP synthase subunit D [Bacteroidales bacterium]